MLLLLFHPGVAGTPTPPAPAEEADLVPGDIGGPRGYQASFKAALERRYAQDEQDLVEILAAITPLITVRR